MALKEIAKEIYLKRHLLPFAILLFFSSAHHIFALWEKSALSIGLSIVIGIPLYFIGLIYLLRSIKLDGLFKDWRKKGLILVLTGILGFVCASKMFDSPKTYHRITITPVATADQMIQLAEVKVNGNVVPLEEQAAESNWQVRDSIFVGTKESQPLTISVYAPVNVPCSVLFYTLPEGGQVAIKYGMVKISNNLSSLQPDQKLMEFKTRYRGIPNWLFIPILFILDWFAFSILIFTGIGLFKQGELIDALPSGNTAPQVNHRRNLLILFFIALVLHTVYALSVPLVLDVDSPSYLDGAVYWAQHGTLDGIPSIRGPSITFLFAPFLYFFGRNPWGIKIFLHLLGIGCALLAYGISWELSKNPRVSFITGVVTILIPDLYFASNVIMSDIANIFFVLLFTYFVLISIRKRKIRWYLPTFLLGSFLVLLRPENIIALGAGILALGIEPLWAIFLERKNRKSIGIQPSSRDVVRIGIAALIACIPILWWCMHNYYHQGFFGLSNCAGQVLYDGWVYYGDASGLQFSDQESEAIKELNEVVSRYPAQISDKTGVATGAEIYFSLLKDGYTLDEAMNLLEVAAFDSIRNDWNLTFRLITLKISGALRPELFSTLTYALEGENPIVRPIEPLYFDPETIRIPAIILSTRWINHWLEIFYRTVYPCWLSGCLVCLFLVLWRRPSVPWLMLFFIAITRIFVPLMMSLANWRYTISAIVFLQIILVNSVYLLFLGAKSMFPNKPQQPHM